MIIHIKERLSWYIDGAEFVFKYLHGIKSLEN